MLCYRDMTFCAAFSSGECVNDKCPRAFTESEAIKARKWWGDADGHAPIAFGDFSDDCADFIRGEAR